MCERVLKGKEGPSSRDAPGSTIKGSGWSGADGVRLRRGGGGAFQDMSRPAKLSWIAPPGLAAILRLIRLLSWPG